MSDIYGPPQPWYARHTRPTTHGLARPAIPFNPKTGGYDLSGLGGKDKTIVKPANVTNFVENVLESKADLSIDERLAFMALTGNEIIEVSRNFDMSNNSLSLNKNVVDSNVVVNSSSPTQLIKMPNSNNDYTNNLTKTTESTQVTINQTTGTSTITAPASTVSSNTATTNTTATTTTTTNQIKVEVSSPAKTVTQNTTPTFSLISFTPTSAKKGTKITVTHEKCNVSSRSVKVGTVTTTSSNMKATTFTLTVPNSASLVVGQQYDISITIGGVTVKAPTKLTILA